MKYPYHKISANKSYSAIELAEVLKVHSQTIINLWKKKGLLPMANNTKPLLYWGDNVKMFLQSKEEESKYKTKPFEFACVKCKKAVTPKDNSIEIVKNANGSYSAKAFCVNCESKINKFVGKDNLDIFTKHYTTNQPEKVTIYRTGNSSLKTHIQAPIKELKNESKIKALKPTALDNQNKTDCLSEKTQIGEQLSLF
jgi:hypothetical protein